MVRRSIWSGLFAMCAAGMLVSPTTALAGSVSAGTAEAATNVRVSYARLSAPQLRSVRTVTFAQQQASAARTLLRPLGGAARIMPLLTGVSRQTYLERKAAAANNPLAPRNLLGTSIRNATLTPTAGPIADGLAESFAICPPFGCQPPDMAIAASPKFVVQGVNGSMAVFDTTGLMLLGYPLDFDAFLAGGPDTVLSGCDPNGPFMSDPRAFFDSGSGRFFVSIGQFDSASLLGDSCPNISIDWIAVSATGNPTGAWFVYQFDTSSGAKELGDYPTLGFNKSLIAFNVNDFNYSTFAFDNNAFTYADKIAMLSGGVPTTASYSITVNSSPIDTIQPVETETTGSTDPGVLYLTASFNMNFGGGNCSSGCSGEMVFGFKKALTGTGLFFQQIETPKYVLAPNADTPIGCKKCVETIDTRETATPTYINTSSTTGSISWALETGVKNATQTVPGILWGRTSVTKPSAGFAASLIDSGFINSASGDQAFSFGTTAQETGGSMFVLSDVMSKTLYNGTVFQVNRPSDPLGTLESASVLKSGVGPDFFPNVLPFGSLLFNSRWGDYEAATLDGTSSTAHIWLSSQYTGGNGDWHTAFGEVK